MIELTAVAAAKLQELRGRVPEKAVLRLYVAGRTCCGYQYGLAFDEDVAETDAVSEHAGIPVAVDAVSSQYCEGAIIDFVDEGGGGFVVRNPSVGGSCACAQR